MAEALTSRARVLRTLRRQPVDRVPTFEWLIDPGVAQALCPGCDVFDFVEWADLDAVVVYADYQKEWLSEDTYRDEWGITWRVMSELYPTSVDFPLKAPGDLEDLIPPDPCVDRRFETLARAVERFGGRRAVVFRLRDAYSLPRYLRGVENLMMDLVLHPDLVHALVKLSVEYYARMADRAHALGADLFFTSDDYCDNRGPLMGAPRWRAFFLPGLERLTRHLHGSGWLLVKHCDGNIMPILADLVAAGVDCIDPIDAEAGVDLAEVKARYGDRVAIKGGVPVGAVLSQGTPRQVTAAVRRCLREAALDGGYILSSSSDITASVRPENYRAMLDALRRYGRYPLNVEEFRQGEVA